MKYTVTGFIPFTIEVEAGSENDALTIAQDSFDVAEFVSYNDPKPVFKKAILLDDSEDDEVTSNFDEESEDEE
jgi:hypothetical protein